MNCHLPTYRLVFATAIFATAIALTGIGRADSSEQFELREATIADIQAAYRDGILSPQHLVSMYLARIAALDRSDLPQPLNGGVGNQPLNSFMHVNENALADAGRLDPEDFMHDGPGITTITWKTAVRILTIALTATTTADARSSASP